MSFLAPLFLLGAAAAALPVIFHLIRRTTRHRTLFSSLLFLPPSPPRVTERSRLEDILLLILRCLVLGLLALGFARPFLRNSPLVDPAARPPQRILVLVDASASMRRAGLWEAVQDRLRHHLRDAAPADEVAVWSFDREVRTLVGFEDWNAMPVGDRAALASSRLAAMGPGWGATHLDAALTQAAEAVIENTERLPAGTRRVIVITDLQEGSRLDQLQAFEWPKGIEVAFDPLKPAHPGNAGLQVVAESSALPTTTQSVVRLRVSNAPDSTRDRFEAGWARAGQAGFEGAAVEVQVAPGQTRTVLLPVAAAADGDGAGGIDRIRLAGDGEPFDDLAYLVPPKSTPVPLLFLGASSASGQAEPLYYLRRALPASGQLGVEIRAIPPSGVVRAEDIESAGLYVLTDPVPQPLAERLRDQVASGKTLLFAPRAVEAFASLGILLGRPGLAAEEVLPRNYAMLGTVDFQHPLLAPFADPRYSDFTRIHFWKYRRFELAAIPEGRAIWRFDSGDPALVEAPVGRGRVVVLASGWHPEDSQLALSTKFVPLLLSLIEWSGGTSGPGTATFVVGDTVPLPGSLQGPLRLRPPEGPDAELPAGATNIAATPVPGIYQVVADRQVYRFAVNVDGAESRTGPLTLETLEAMGTPVRAGPAPAGPTPERRVQLAAIESESRQKLWRWLIVAALAVLLLESALAGWQSRRMAVGKEITP